jgi:hypothetical protein
MSSRAARRRLALLYKDRIWSTVPRHMSYLPKTSSLHVLGYMITLLYSSQSSTLLFTLVTIEVKIDHAIRSSGIESDTANHSDSQTRRALDRRALKRLK